MSRPTEGGSYLRKPDGTLERFELPRMVEAVRPANAAATAAVAAASPSKSETEPAQRKAARVKKDA